MNPEPDPTPYHRLAVETLTGNSSLRDNLRDDQAQALLDWALARLAADLPQTAVLPPAAAETWLDDWLTAVTGIMRAVNRLTPDLAQMDPAAAAAEIERLLGHLRQLAGSIDTWPAIALLASPPSPDETFSQLLQLISQPTTEEEE